jgi:hypothetical protein
MQLSKLNHLKWAIAIAAISVTVSSAAIAKPKYWVVRATMSCTDCGSSDTVPAIIGNTGSFITSKAECEKLRAEFIATAKSNGLKVKSKCVVTNNPAAEN